MADVVLERNLAAPADRLWAVLRDFGDVSWIPPAGKVDVDGDGPGMRRHIHGSGGDPVVERLLDLDDEARTLRYCIEGDSPLPVSSYVGTVTVTDERLRWAVTYEPVGDEAEAKTVVELMVGALAAWLEEAAQQ